MSLDLLAGLSDERAKALVSELSFDQLCGLLMVKARLEGKRVNLHIRHLEARVRPPKPAKVKIVRAGGYDPALGRANVDPTLEEGT